MNLKSFLRLAVSYLKMLHQEETDCRASEVQFLFMQQELQQTVMGAGVLHCCTKRGEVKSFLNCKILHNSVGSKLCGQIMDWLSLTNSCWFSLVCLCLKNEYFSNIFKTLFYLLLSFLVFTSVIGHIIIPSIYQYQ